ncbi:MAG: hypothetical protein IKD15_04015 [Clostridia bacterium]|nr:hypothetical protein [Clostridia bacterium]
MKKVKKEKQTPRREWWFRGLLKLMKGRYPEPEFIYLGEKVQKGSLILSNHEGTDAPLSLEMYLGENVTMWGAHEMNEGVVNMYKYQTRVYYHEKKHWNLHLARLFCLLASPLTNMFYKGLDLISTYRDHRFLKTIRESIAALKKGESIVVFPEDSKNGYLPELEGFFAGFVMLAEVCKKQGMDLQIYVSYFKKKERQYIFDKPVAYSQLTANGETREEVAKRLLDRCNELGKMTFEKKTDDQAA